MAPPLKTRLIEQIRLDGPMTIADYMWACLHDPYDGYYATRPALGAEGDFITAPLVSQVFGELLGLWTLQVWQDMGAPDRVSIVEIGPGDGTLMADMHRSFSLMPAFQSAARIYMVEASAPLKSLQAARVPEVTHLDSLHHIPTDAPVIIIANEVLDCLPARQFQLAPEGWHERRVGLDEQGELCIGLIPAPEGFTAPFEAVTPQVAEISPAQNQFVEAISGIVKTATGAALFIDYGRDTPEAGDTLQALYRHEKRDPLEAPGQHDLTQWADFPSLRITAARSGLHAAPLTPQGIFLQRLGIETRFEALASKNPDQAEKLFRQFERLTAEDEMGSLFKVMGLSYPPRPLPALDI
ncbi:MAG: SAM-dependent methyltransferase [Asticcacaulis sp.]